MLYDIKLRIAYTYESPAEASRTVLRMLPRNTEGQALIYGSVTCDPMPTFRADVVDFFGNPVTDMAHDMALTDIAFCFEGRVRRDAAPVGLDLSGPWERMEDEVRAVRSIDGLSPHHFTGPSPRLRHEPEIADYARAVAGQGMSTLSVVRAVSKALHGDFNFDPTATDVTTTPLEAFRARHGVCQDISHVMITALRGIGIPAGYVSGFLRTEPPEGQPRLEGADAMHAWVRAWCGVEMGWVEIDPTNDMDVAGDHVVVAMGRDYSDVAPVKGALRSMGSHDTTHQVDMIPVG